MRLNQVGMVDGSLCSKAGGSLFAQLHWQPSVLQCKIVLRKKNMSMIRESLHDK